MDFNKLNYEQKQTRSLQRWRIGHHHHHHGLGNQSTRRRQSWVFKALIPVFLSYVLSFVYVGIYWNNHHHMLQVVKRINGSILWSNLFLLFWLSLIPFATSWIGEHHFSAVPMSIYGLVLLMCAIAYNILQNKIIKLEGEDSILQRAVEKDFKGKISNFTYLSAIPLAFVSP